jgi:hypothetical protein
MSFKTMDDGQVLLYAVSAYQDVLKCSPSILFNRLLCDSASCIMLSYLSRVQGFHVSIPEHKKPF